MSTRIQEPMPQDLSELDNAVARHRVSMNYEWLKVKRYFSSNKLTYIYWYTYVLYAIPLMCFKSHLLPFVVKRTESNYYKQVTIVINAVFL